MAVSKYQAYYTNSIPIVSYMTNMLNLTYGDFVLEPCGGEGVFVDEIIAREPDAKIKILELNPKTVTLLRSKYENISTKVEVKETNTLLDNEILSKGILYDKIIGNPPYGARYEENQKNKINQIYSNLYTKESYTLFLYACINCLKEGGILSFIVPDTFLSLHRHIGIRQFILRQTKLIELMLFPSSYFPGVNFGYANLCIVTLQKNSNVSKNSENAFDVRTGFSHVSDLTDPNKGIRSKYIQSEVYKNPGSAFYFNQNIDLNNLLTDIDTQCIGDIANCVTGFYSGCDKDFLHPLSISQKNAKKYSIAASEDICERELSVHERTGGIKSGPSLIPIVKGGNKCYVKKNEWFMDWSASAVENYHTCKKSRFQNSSFYFRKGGIAIPMVRSGKLTAALIEERLFDQSIVGVFPYDDSLSYYLLAFFNSDVCSKIIGIINPSTNNSANYIKKIPFIKPDKEVFDYVSQRTQHIVEILKQDSEEELEEYQADMNNIFNQIYGRD